MDRQGKVYVSNYSVVNYGGPGNVAIYAKGSVNPTKFLSSASVYNVYGITIDKSHDVFITATPNASTGTAIDEFKLDKRGSYTFETLVDQARATGVCNLMRRVT